MSLINKMLKDLDSRQGATGGRPIFEGLQPGRRVLPGANRAVRLMALIGLILSVSALVWVFFGINSTPVPAPVAQAPVTPHPVKATPATLAPAPPVAALQPAPKIPARQVAAAPAAPRQATGNAGRETPVASPLPRAPAAGRMEKTDRPYTPEELVEEAYREAGSLRASGNGAGAERRLKELLATTPRHVRAREMLVSILNENGRWVEARATLEAGIASVPEHAAFRLYLARVLLEHTGEKEAITVLEEGRSSGRVDPELQAFLAALYQRVARHDDAVKAYREALGVNPQEGRWWVGLGISLEAQQDSNGAREAYQRALASTRLPANLAQYAEGRLQALAPR